MKVNAFLTAISVITRLDPDSDLIISTYDEHLHLDCFEGDFHVSVDFKCLENG